VRLEHKRRKKERKERKLIPGTADEERILPQVGCCPRYTTLHVKLK
jgi:hypothetical protein